MRQLHRHRQSAVTDAYPRATRPACTGINAIEMMFFIPAYLFWTLVIIAADVVALWGLCAYGNRENLETV